ncbi:MAG: Ig-like domain-containing protein, partial [archaeon]|nr:Ig-like domain-containing protein [archaeon]
ISCSFVNCSAVDDGGAIYSHKNRLCEIISCSFVNCSAVDDGGAIYSHKNRLCEIISCSFVNCSAVDDGGAIYWNGTKGVVNYNIFDNNHRYAIAGRSVDCDFNFFAFENNITSFPDGLVSGSTVNNWIVLNISRDDANYSVDFICNEVSALTKSMYDYTAKLNINGDVKEITIKNNTFKDTIVFEDYLLTSPNSGNVLAKTNFSKKSTDYNITTYGVYGENATVTVKVNESATGTISVKVDYGQIFTGVIEDGVVTIILSNLSTGVHNLFISYSGDDNYLPSNITTNLTVNKNANYNMSISTNNITVVEDEVIKVNLPIDTNGLVMINLNGADYLAKVEKGIGTLIIKDLKIKNYSVTAFYSDGNYELKNVTSNFVVNGLNPNLTVDSVSATKDSSVDLIAHLDSNATGFVIFYINDTKVGISEIENGIANYTYIPNNVGDFSIKAIYKGDDVYSSSNASANLTVNPINVNLIPSALSTTYDSANYFEVKVVDSSNKSVSGLKLALKVYTGSSYKTVYVTTNANGIAKYSASKLNIGTHKVTVTVSNHNYNASVKSSSIKVAKAPTLVTAKKVTYKKGAKKYFKITIKNKATKKVVKSLTLKIKVYTGKKHKTYKVKTNTKGIAKLNTKSFAKGTHKVIIGTTSKYYAVSKSGKLIVIK